jgi:hypothetical protein
MRAWLPDQKARINMGNVSHHKVPFVHSQVVCGVKAESQPFRAKHPGSRPGLDLYKPWTYPRTVLEGMLRYGGRVVLNQTL